MKTCTPLRAHSPLLTTHHMREGGGENEPRVRVLGWYFFLSQGIPLMDKILIVMIESNLAIWDEGIEIIVIREIAWSLPEVYTTIWPLLACLHFYLNILLNFNWDICSPMLHIIMFLNQMITSRLSFFNMSYRYKRHPLLIDTLSIVLLLKSKCQPMLYCEHCNQLFNKDLMNLLCTYDKIKFNKLTII